MPLIKLNDRSIKDVTSLPFGVGNLVHIQSQTASNSASISFTTGINSTYKEYQFYFIDIHPRTDDVNFTFNLSTDSGSNYNVTKTTTAFLSYHNESGTDSGLAYTNFSLAQSTSYQVLSNNIGSGADETCVGSMSLFNPSSTIYVKHFITSMNRYFYDNYSANVFVAGYGNTTSAINAMDFKMSSGNFDGTIAMFGVL
jgi:hypothetical protein